MNVKSVAVNIILLALSLSLALGGAEWFLAYNNWHPDTKAFLVDVTLNGATYHLIDRAEAISEPKGAVLIAGDSFTAGNACANNQTYPAAFTKAAARSGHALHAINMGIPGTGPFSYAVRIKNYFAEHGPTAGAILTLYANDAEIDCEVCSYLHEWEDLGGFTPEQRNELQQLCAVCSKQRINQPIAGEVDSSRRVNWWLAERSLTYQLMREVGARIAVRMGWLKMDWGRGAFPARWRADDGLYFKYVRASVEYAKSEADRRGVPLMIVFYPDPVQMEPSNEFVEIYRTVARRLTDETGVPAYSGYDAFLGNPAAQANMPFSLTDTHPNCKAHEIFGDWVYAKWASQFPDATPMAERH
jgi:hypothetical protein